MKITNVIISLFVLSLIVIVVMVTATNRKTDMSPILEDMIKANVALINMESDDALNAYHELSSLDAIPHMLHYIKFLEAYKEGVPKHIAKQPFHLDLALAYGRMSTLYENTEEIVLAEQFLNRAEEYYRVYKPSGAKEGELRGLIEKLDLNEKSK